MSSSHPLEGKCGAQLRGQPGRFCEKDPMVNGRCKFHGGKSLPPGPAHPTFKTGKYSKALGRFAAAYEASLADEASLMDLREPLALLDLQVMKAAERAGDLDTPGFRVRAVELYDAAELAMQSNPAAAAQRLKELGQLLRKGTVEDAALGALTRAAERLATRLEGAWKVRLSAQNSVNVADLQVAFGRLLTIFCDEANDRALVARVVRRFHAECNQSRLGDVGARVMTARTATGASR